MIYPSLYEFTETGMEYFDKVFTGHIGDDFIDPMDSSIAQKVPGTGSLEIKAYATAKEMAAAVLKALGTNEMGAVINNTALWAWLTFVLRDVVFPKDAAGHRKPGEVHKWYPTKLSDWQKGQRHLIRMPVQLLAELGDDGDHLLCRAPHIGSEIREQLTSQQDMFHPTFQRAAKLLYFDEETENLKRGAGGKSGGSPRRLAKVRDQLDVTWDLFSLTPERLVEILPKEFNRFKPEIDGQLKPAA